jgi:hypothetical protein
MSSSENSAAMEKPMLDTAWAVLEAANDLRDGAVVEACRRVIDAAYRGDTPAQPDIKLMLGFFE